MSWTYRRSLAIGAMALLPLGLINLSPFAHWGQSQPVARYRQELQHHSGGLAEEHLRETTYAMGDVTQGLGSGGIVGSIADPATLTAHVSPVSGSFGTSTLKFLDYGTPVSILQQDLAKLGWYHGKVDGIFNAATVAAVKRFQRHHGFADNAVVYPTVAQAIQHALNPHPVTQASFTPTTSHSKSAPLMLGYYVPGQAA
ncbi:peptidoglycan-binding domain-containing protein [Sulfobacillus harzensis]|uniref:Peptidoglycan-binding protein n=1 Tax=Sulfobacillus harzensis TaxID=2729629 RepID=A0A7Y0L2Q8_9FIRM|nr:peptidoglycan-binding protein [Sulfobacillus harzensis]NMP21315.1 peptidoglycan-binding protein [Sulfobacillus harzensis]